MFLEKKKEECFLTLPQIEIILMPPFYLKTLHPHESCVQ